ncbi:MAG: hypothetical protein IJM97_02250 [Clostridia bacterium]|nr:hypothetical protein [Clostridia bacterium]MBQ6707755.1 hypothetical protein [Clostridia bacterium]
MKNIKKLIALTATICILVSALSTAAFAFGGTAVGNEKMDIAIVTDKTSVHAGDVVKVSINISNNYNAANMRWPVLFDNSVFELGTEAETDFTAASVLTPGTSGINTDIDTQTAIGAGVTSSSFKVEDYNAVLIQWVAGSSAENGTQTMNCFNSSASVTCFTFNLKVKADLEGPTAIDGRIFIPSEATTFYYMAMNSKTDATTIYTMDKETCLMTFDDAVVTVKFLNPEIVLLNESVVLDYDNNAIYGLAEGLSSIEDYVTVTDGYVEYTRFATDNTVAPFEGVVGTGTYVTFMGNDGTNLGEFFVVIFGDYNGDGLVDLEDDTYFASIANYEIMDYFESQYLFLACDVNGDGSVDTMDATDVSSVANYDAYVDQTLAENRVVSYS